MCETTRTVIVRSGEIEVPTCIAGHVVNLTHAHVGVAYADCGTDDPEPVDWLSSHDLGRDERGYYWRDHPEGQRFAAPPSNMAWVPRARILIDIEDADAAFDAGYWVDIPTLPTFDRIYADTILEVTVPRTALQGPDEIPIPAWRLAEVQARSTVIL